MRPGLNKLDNRFDHRSKLNSKLLTPLHLHHRTESGRDSSKLSNNKKECSVGSTRD